MSYYRGKKHVSLCEIVVLTKSNDWMVLFSLDFEFISYLLLLGAVLFQAVLYIGNRLPPVNYIYISGCRWQRCT